MARMNWSKRNLRAGEYEEKYDPGTELLSGRTVAPIKLTGLAARAAQAEKAWIEERAAKAKKQRQRRRKAKRDAKPPTHAETVRLKQIRTQLGYGDA
ncbi:hypothetical protein [Tardiphaga sp.]|uniref:hypothetical protein n=1 Tax=Tardiphaga sp. TaxID=1926292 RepID=UPI002608446D|nr:hypothetical protein [Tardiphaga sp.]MDB5620550.1 hypothetical protein [Tardiphaga sp.]